MRAVAWIGLAACSTPEREIAPHAAFAPVASIEPEARDAEAPAVVVSVAPLPSAAHASTARIASTPSTASTAAARTQSAAADVVPSPARIAGHFCFTWRSGHESSNPCYASLASCNAERRALGQTEELTRCLERKGAVCTRVSPGGDLAEGRHCFGDSARCIAFRAAAVGHADTTACAYD